MDICGTLEPPLVVEEPMFQPVPTASGHIHRFPRQYKDFLSSSATSVPHMPNRPPRIIITNPVVTCSPSPPPEVPQIVEPTLLEMELNEFGLFCVYTTFLTNTPDKTIDLDDLCDAPSLCSSKLVVRVWFRH